MSEQIDFNKTDELKDDLRSFYDQVGWTEVGHGLYQNARFEDLRPVSREYISRCHQRLNRYLPQSGRFLLDAGSGPIQYPEYLEYSDGYVYRLCLDISFTALAEARKRIGGHGLFVVGDIAHLPFKSDVMDGIVSMHTVHHLPPGEHKSAFLEMYRVLMQRGAAVIVYNWGQKSVFGWLSRRSASYLFSLWRFLSRVKSLIDSRSQDAADVDSQDSNSSSTREITYTFTHTYRWAKKALGNLPGFDVHIWRTFGVSFLRAFIHARLGGRWFLKIIYALEERMPGFFGRHGMYPIILFRKEEQQ